MRNLYKIERIKRGSFNRKQALCDYKALQEIRHKFAEVINISRKKHSKLHSDRIVDILRDQVQSVRDSYKRELKNPFYVTVITREDRGSIIQREISGYETRLSAIQNIKEELRELRRERREIRSKLLKRLPNEFLKRLYRRRLSTPKSPHADDHTQYVGIEIECLTPRGVDFSKLAQFHNYLAIGSDGSINCEGDTEGTEFRILVKRDEVHAIVPEILKTIHELGARVNRSCGLHVHLDQRYAANPALNYQKLVRAQSLLYAVVPASRRDNQYCKRTREYNFEYARNGRRYHAINPCAYNRYRTLEVRLFGGTLDADKIVNWIDTLHGIVEGKTVLRCPKNFDLAKKYWKLSDENIAWLKARQEKFSALNGAPTAESDNAEPEPIETPNASDPLEHRSSLIARRGPGNTIRFPSYGSFIAVDESTNVNVVFGNGQLGRIESTSFIDGTTPPNPPEITTFRALSADTVRRAVETLRDGTSIYRQNIDSTISFPNVSNEEAPF